MSQKKEGEEITIQLGPGLVLNPSPLQRLYMRKTIIQLLKKSFEVEYQKDLESYLGMPITEKRIYMRYYNMTVPEYEEGKNYCIYFIFEDNLEHIEYTEGLCYDVRTLLSEKYIQLNLSIGFIPIPLSSSRWTFLHKENADLLSVLSKEPGILCYPLLREELMVISEKIKDGPILCTNEESCTLTSNEQLQRYKYMIYQLYDLSPTERYMKKNETKIPELYFQTPYTMTPKSPEEVNDKIKYIKERLIEAATNMSILDVRLPKENNRTVKDEINQSDPILKEKLKTMYEEVVISDFLDVIIQKLLSNE